MSIFREYDIRGIFEKELNYATVARIGFALGKEIAMRGGKSVGIGYDARTHSPILFQWLCDGICAFNDSHSQKSSVDSQKSHLDSRESCALQIYDLGMIPTPCAYFSLYVPQNPLDSSIMITGSHNPPQYNGFKITILKKPFYGEDIKKLGEMLMTSPLGNHSADSANFECSQTPSLVSHSKFAENHESNTANLESLKSSLKNPPPLAGGARGGVESHNSHKSKIPKHSALAQYIDFLTAHFAHLKNFPHKVAFDCGNGVASLALESVLKNLQIPYYPLFFVPDGEFPNHHPDPSEDKNLADLKREMQENDIKIGIAFDGDADRVALLTQNYHFKGDELAVLFAQNIAKNGTKPVVIGEVKCSAVMYSEINKIGTAIMHKTGHSNLKVKLSETNAHLAAEMSGHIFFNDRYFGYDDAIYASFRALELFLDTSIEGIENAIKSLPQMFSTSEEKIDSSEDVKFRVIKSLAQKLKNPPRDFPKILDIITIDGIRVVFENGWGLIRASNTTPVLVTRFEATSADLARIYKEKMLDLLKDCQ